MVRYVAFLRGINVSGHHKIPMAELRAEMEKLDFKNVVTILNSGNVIFDSINNDPEDLENTISHHLENTFGFQVPTIIRPSDLILGLIDDNPFKDVEVTKDIRLYASFLWKDSDVNLPLPWTTDDGAYKIVASKNKTVLSVLDLAVTKTPKGMEALEKHFGKDITTRNWNTIKRIEKKLDATHE